MPLTAPKPYLEKILSSEEEHADWLEALLELIEQSRTQNYLAQQRYAWPERAR